MSGPFGSSQWMYNADSGYQIANSLRTPTVNSGYLNITPDASNRRTFTWSFWVKRANHIQYSSTIVDCGGNNNAVFRIQINYATGVLSAYDYNGTSNQYEWTLVTNARLRDFGSWYHIIVAIDTTQGTNTNRGKIYINGVDQVGGYVNDYYPGENYQSHCNSNTVHKFAATHSNDANFVGEFAEVNFIDGAAKTPADFGETGDYGEWKPIKYEGSYGDNGFYFDFKSAGVGTASSSTVGADRSGNDNHWTSNGLAAHDQMLDTPTNNFCTLNHLDSNQGTTEGDLKTTANNDWRNTRGTMFVSSGKWYWETVKTSTASVYTQNGAATSEPSLLEDYGDAQDGLFVYSAHNGSKVGQGSAPASYGDSYATGEVIGVALDMDNGTIKFYKNNTIQNSGTAAFTNLSGDVAPWMSGYNNTMVGNFGQDSSFAGAKTAQGNADGKGQGDFFYTPPSGYLALCTKNLAEPAVVPSENFKTVIYEGDGSAQDITTVGFLPDFTWIKNRDTTDMHQLFDSLRGVTKVLLSNASTSEATNDDTLTAFLSNGFTTGDDVVTNTDGENYVAWNWKAGGNAATVGSNTDGSINTTDTSANVAAGFSISTYVGTGSAATIGHGLSKVPEMYIIRQRNASGSWWTYHKDLAASDPETDAIRLNLSDAKSDDATIFNDTAPTTSVFSIGTYADVNRNTGTFVALAFHSVDGYSKVGSYIGNNAADGPYVHLGFRPAFVLTKAIAGTGDWTIHDSVRDTDNPLSNELNANEPAAEGTSDVDMDFNSNGFKIRRASGQFNTDGGVIIFLAFAETPFKYANAR